LTITPTDSIYSKSPTLIVRNNDTDFPFTDFPGMLESAKRRVIFFNDEMARLDIDLSAYKSNCGLSPTDAFNTVYWTAITAGTTDPNDTENEEIVAVLINFSFDYLTHTNPDESWSTPTYNLLAGNIIDVGLNNVNNAHGLYSGMIEVYTTDLRLAYCFVPRHDGNCRQPPDIGVPAPLVCTIIPSTNNESLDCNVWLQSQTVAKQNAYKQELCGNNPEYTECDCVSRSSRTAFQIGEKDPITNSIPAGCWWKPCKIDDLSTWVTSNDRVAEGACPQNLCLNIVDFDDLDENQIGEIKQYVSCSTSSTDNTGGGGDGNDGSIFGSVSMPLVIGVGAGILVFFIIVGVVIALLRKKAASASHEGETPEQKKVREAKEAETAKAQRAKDAEKSKADADKAKKTREADKAKADAQSAKDRQSRVDDKAKADAQSAKDRQSRADGQAKEAQKTEKLKTDRAATQGKGESKEDQYRRERLENLKKANG
jgi:hypothetical protein